jgi:hypothetical protein
MEGMGMNAPAKNIQAASLHTAMAAAFGEIEAATKSASGQVGQQKYKYADLGSVIEAIKPPLIRHGLWFTQCPRPNPDGAEVETFVHHASGESMSLGSVYLPASKRDAQAFGSALTYCRRYGLQTAFGVPTEDDDGNAAVKAAAGYSQGGAISQQQPITDDQFSQLQELIEATNSNVKAVCDYFKIASLNKLPTDQFAAAKAMLDAKLAKMAKETA